MPMLVGGPKEGIRDEDLAGRGRMYCCAALYHFVNISQKATLVEEEEQEKSLLSKWG
jgi:hypothetical protein